MLEHITWGQYLTTVALTAGIYYSVVGIKYYRKELKSLLKKDNSKMDNDHSKVADESPVQEHVDVEFDELEELVSGIRFGILEKAGDEATKETLLEEIRESVASFSGLHNPAYRYALTNFIMQQGMVICGIVFSEEELEAVWESLSR